MILISPQTAENLYWMGRYIQRAETMTRLVIQSFDKILDIDPDEGTRLYAKMGVELIYKTPQEFLQKSIFGLEYASLIYTIDNARENAIVTRSHLPNRMFSRINALYLKYQNAKETLPVSIFWLESTLQELDAIWGNLELSLVEAKEIPFIEFGRITERMDLNIRLYNSMEAALFDLEKLNLLGFKLTPHYKKLSLSSSNIEKTLKKINGLYYGTVITAS
ncbi:MAG: alpha-E domain-containing protein [Sulfurospirillaceae bacterium]|nr:alpha-E domain-containing protein [Sulfurospirillaceae bacterium]